VWASRFDTWAGLPKDQIRGPALAKVKGKNIIKFKKY